MNPTLRRLQSGLILPTTPIIEHHARMVAKERSRAHDGRRTKEQIIDTPSAMALCEYYGSLGEVTLLDSLFRAGLNPQGYTLIAEGKVPAGPDFHLPEGASFQTKSVPAAKLYLTLNERQRLNPKHHAYPHSK